MSWSLVVSPSRLERIFEVLVTRNLSSGEIILSGTTKRLAYLRGDDRLSVSLTEPSPWSSGDAFRVCFSWRICSFHAGRL